MPPCPAQAVHNVPVVVAVVALVVEIEAVRQTAPVRTPEEGMAVLAAGQGGHFGQGAQVTAPGHIASHSRSAAAVVPPAAVRAAVVLRYSTFSLSPFNHSTARSPLARHHFLQLRSLSYHN
jgi:hypothetical protein